MTAPPSRTPLQFEDIDDVLKALRAAGHRVSAPARAVLDALFAADGPISAESIAAQPAGAGAGTELTSVYRNLERLQQLGVVAHVHVGHGAGLYVLTNEGPFEYLVCENCGAVESVRPRQLDGVRDLLHGEFGFTPQFAHFPIHGICADCER